MDFSKNYYLLPKNRPNEEEMSQKTQCPSFWRIKKNPHHDKPYNIIML